MCVEMEILKNGNMKFLVTDKEEFNEELLRLDDENSHYTDESLFIDLIESYLCNGYSLVDPMNCGALTESLIISDEYIDEDTSKEIFEAANFWWFPRYTINGYCELLKNDGEIIFEKS